MQIGDDFYEDLTPATTIKVLSALAKGEKPKPGPQTGRKTSEVSVAVLGCWERQYACAVRGGPERRMS
jgi:NADH dehydrogenase (ubiquinone) flavoprotein 2